MGRFDSRPKPKVAANYGGWDRIIIHVPTLITVLFVFDIAVNKAKNFLCLHTRFIEPDIVDPDIMKTR